MHEKGQLLANPCGTNERTQRLTLDNNTGEDVELWLVQLKDLSGVILPGYVADSGVAVAGTGIHARSSDTYDPCMSNIAIQANEATGSVSVNGNRIDLDRAYVAPPQYIGTTGWTLAYGESMDGEQTIVATAIGDGERKETA